MVVVHHKKLFLSIHPSYEIDRLNSVLFHCCVVEVITAAYKSFRWIMVRTIYPDTDTLQLRQNVYVRSTRTQIYYSSGKIMSVRFTRTRTHYSSGLVMYARSSQTQTHYRSGKVMSVRSTRTQTHCSSGKIMSVRSTRTQTQSKGISVFRSLYMLLFAIYFT